MTNLDFQGKVFSSHMPLNEEIEDISKTKFGTHHDLNSQIKELANKIDRVVEVNMVLQDKIAKLGIQVAEMTQKVNSLINEIPSTIESIEKEMPPQLNLKPIPSLNIEIEEPRRSENRDVNVLINSLQKLTEQNAEIAQSLKSVNRNIKEDKGQKLREALSKVV